MDDLKTVYGKYLTEDLVLCVASNPAYKSDGLPLKLKIKPVFLKGVLMFAAVETVGTRELRKNYNAADMAEVLYGYTSYERAEANRTEAAAEGNTAGQFFRQIELKNHEMQCTVMISSKGRVTVKESKVKGQNAGTGVVINGMYPAGQHDRVKNYVLEEGVPVPFLTELGVMNAAGCVIKAKYDKFRQINRYLEFVEDIIGSLPKGRELRIIDFGCGKSYLTFALYYYLHDKKGYDVRITGLDLKKDVIENCNELAKKLGYTKLEFLHGDIADYTGTDSVDMVVTLHACDTATDYALFKAISWNARIIFCVPCCQHELNKQLADKHTGISNRDVTAFKYGLIRERMAALYTDVFRAEMLEEQGYRTQILEFIDMEHTPKNILIRAVRRPAQLMADKTDDGQKSSYKLLMEELGVEPLLYRLLNGQHPSNSDKNE